MTKQNSESSDSRDTIIKKIQEQICTPLAINDLAELKSWLLVEVKNLKGRESIYNSLLHVESTEITQMTKFELLNLLNNELHILTISEYAKMCGRTLNDLGTPEANELHMILGIVTEAGESADAYKKNFAYGRDLDRVNVSEELGGDCMWYIQNWFNMTGMSLYRSLYANIEKLKARYPDGFEQDKAYERDLITERKILEKHV